MATVCEEARCPNIAECWQGGTATFMLLGDTCTRGCRFCNVKTGNPRGVVDHREPDHIDEAVTAMDLEYVVLTMVDRDDLDDGGADHVARTIEVVKTRHPDLLVEILAGDFRGLDDSVERVIEARPDVFAHNVETVRRLTPRVRDRRSSYEQTLAVLKRAKRLRPDGITKSSIMLGLGETDDEIADTLRDLRSVDCDIVTLGQYLRPSMKHLPVEEYVTPEAFERWKVRAESMGFAFAASGPLVRSSYRAGELFIQRYLKERRDEVATGQHQGQTS